MSDHVLLATLLMALALVTLVDVGTSGAVGIGLAATPFIVLLLHRQATRAI